MGSPSGPTIVVADTADVALQTAVARLLPQLSSSSPPPNLADLRRLVEDPAVTLLLALSAGGAEPNDGDGGGDGDKSTRGQVVGMLTLALFRLPTGIRAWIEDVVVDDASRGSGVAGAPTQAALDRARQQGARTVELTSRPEREAANRLYLRLGFERRQTNVYRYTLNT